MSSKRKSTFAIAASAKRQTLECSTKVDWIRQAEKDSTMFAQPVCDTLSKIHMYCSQLEKNMPGSFRSSCSNAEKLSSGSASPKKYKSSRHCSSATKIDIKSQVNKRHKSSAFHFSVAEGSSTRKPVPMSSLPLSAPSSPSSMSGAAGASPTARTRSSSATGSMRKPLSHIITPQHLPQCTTSLPFRLPNLNLNPRANSTVSSSMGSHSTLIGRKVCADILDLYFSDLVLSKLNAQNDDSSSCSEDSSEG
mmetsp:Transcript_15536/g.30507  ORF Transcript_15536/g.30507 Transcript_15536/m.30507 type:complete len:250 (-) Transcript_15536:39-788(-)